MSFLNPADQPGVGERATTEYTLPEYTGKATSPEQYLFESIVDPNVFVVSPFASGLMPQNYGATLTDQNMADLIAYLLSLK